MKQSGRIFAKNRIGSIRMIFHGTFSPAYYRRLHRYVHRLFRFRKGLRLIADLLTFKVSFHRKQWRAILLTGYFAPAALIDRCTLLFLAHR